MSRTIDTLAWIGQRIGKPPGWERVVRLFASPEKCRGMRELCVVRDGTVFMVQPGVPLGWHIAFFGTYEPDLREVFGGVLRPGGIAVDVGANVGWHTLRMAGLVGEGGRVYAAEANPSVRARLTEHLRINRNRNVEIVPYALGRADGHVEFHAPDVGDPAAGDGHVLLADDTGGPDVVRVEMRTLDGILASGQLDRLDLIKIDVEGYEWPVIQGAEQVIANFRPHIVFEYIGEYAGRGGGTPQVLAAFFARHGYRLFAIGRNWSESIAEQWPSNANIWAVPRSESDARGTS